LRLPDALWRNPREFLLVILAFACAAFSATLLCALPFAAPYLYLRAWYRSCVALAQLRSRAWAAVVVGLSVMLIAAVFSLSLTQPQTEAFERLSTPPHSDGERRSLLAHADALRDGLQNAYLAAYRYQGTAGLPRAVSEQYRHAFGGSLEDWRVLGLWHDLLAAPWLYQGESIAGDARRAAELYTQFFDAQIQRDQREAVSAALNATYDRDGIEAGVLNIGSARVLLLSQNIEVTEHGDMADVEWSEVYQNQTLQPQEVLYYFSLPQSAVVTGLWLGESPDKASAAAFVVAPRGAAARVYRASVRRSIDPALLEQVGPRQYRLRVFPIPAKDYRTDEAKPLYLWLRYSVMATPDGWPAPRLLERRNVFWTEQSKRAHNGVLSTDEAPWSPAALPRNSATKPTVHTATLQGGLRVTATPTATPIAAAARGLRLLVVVDRSYSMRAVQGPLQTALQRLAQTGHDVDYCLSAAPSRGEPARMTRRVGEADLLFYGGHPQSTLLQQMGELALTHPYHAVIVLTDAGGYDLESKDVPPAAALYRRDAPLWLVHLGGGLPFAYADEVWAAVHRSGGGIATTLDEALLQIEPRLSGGLSSQAVARFADGYLWRVERSDVATTTPTDEAFVPLAARAALAAMQATAEADTPTAQDDMHALAKSYGIISPLSSMIVLVTDAQREALRQAQHAQDRFKRDTENGVEDLTAPSGSDVVSGVPEPQEWALLLAAAAMAAIYLYRNKNPLRRVL
jgi:putative PEP-CTERM system integral membrane protein